MFAGRMRGFLLRSTSRSSQRNERKRAYYGQIMSFFSDTQETAGRYGKYIPEFQELFRKHEVSFGTPKDFLRLASKLAYDERLSRGVFRTGEVGGGTGRGPP